MRASNNVERFSINFEVALLTDLINLFILSQFFFEACVVHLKVIGHFFRCLKEIGKSWGELNYALPLTVTISA